MRLSIAAPTPCPICALPGGFHDTEDLWAPSKHRAHVVPRHLVRPSNTAVRKAARRTRLYVAAAALILLGTVTTVAGLQPAAPTPAPPAGRGQLVRTLTPAETAAADLHRRLELWQVCQQSTWDGCRERAR